MNHEIHKKHERSSKNYYVLILVCLVTFVVKNRVQKKWKN